MMKRLFKCDECKEEFNVDSEYADVDELLFCPVCNNGNPRMVEDEDLS